LQEPRQEVHGRTRDNGLPSSPFPHARPPASFPASRLPSSAPRVASGGPDKLVLLWDLDDAAAGICAGKRGADNTSTTHIKAR
jgi:hypothetical protein